MTEEELKLSYFKTEPIPASILERMEECRRKGMLVPDETLIKRPSQIAGIREASRINAAVLDEVAGKIHVGMTTQEIDDIVQEFTHAQGAICAPYQFEGFPKSVCTSINNEVCHGIRQDTASFMKAISSTLMRQRFIKDITVTQAVCS